MHWLRLCKTPLFVSLDPMGFRALEILPERVIKQWKPALWLRNAAACLDQLAYSVNCRAMHNMVQVIWQESASAIQGGQEQTAVSKSAD
jgi:hypothetical protein